MILGSVVKVAAPVRLYAHSVHRVNPLAVLGGELLSLGANGRACKFKFLQRIKRSQNEHDIAQTCMRNELFIYSTAVG